MAATLSAMEKQQRDQLSIPDGGAAHEISDQNDGVEEAQPAESTKPDESLENLEDCTDESKHAAQTPASSWSVWFSKRLRRPQRPSVIFSGRVGFALTLASIFVFFSSPPAVDSNEGDGVRVKEEYPEAVWVYVTATIVSFLPSLDTATALKKIVERCIGTLLGALMAMCLGYMSIAICDSDRGQSFFLAIFSVFMAFAFPFAAAEYGYRSSYAALLSLVTFGLVLYSFHGVGVEDRHFDGAWRTGTFRVINIFIGCILGGLSSLVVWPQSTKTCIEHRSRMQLNMAGQSAAAVLQSAVDAFVHNRRLPLYIAITRFHDPLTSSGEDDESWEDDAISAYVRGMEAWKESRAMFPMLPYDPFYRFTRSADRVVFTDHMSERIGRTFLIQNTIVLLDTIVRGGALHKASVEGQNHDNHDSWIFLADIGECVRILLDVTSTMEEAQAAEEKLVDTHLVQVRKHMTCRRNNGFDSTDEEAASSSLARFDPRKLRDAWLTFNSQSNQDTFVRPMQSLEQQGQVDLFLHLVEHLLLRSVRQFHFVRNYHNV